MAVEKRGSGAFALFILACVVLAWSFRMPGAGGSARIKLATLAPRGSSFHRILQAMGERWRGAPGGGVSLTVYTDGTMGGEADMVRKMRIGQIQAAMLTAVGLREIDDSVTAIQFMPMMFRSLDEIDYVREKLAPELEKRMLDKGFVVLFWGDAGWVRLFSRGPVLRPRDLKGMKLCALAGDSYQIDIMKAAGYQPVPIETSDILPGLQTGLVNALFTQPFYALSTQAYGQASHMLELNWAPLVGATVVTRKAWDALPVETRASLRSAATEAGADITSRSRAESDESVEAMRKRGLVVHPVPPELDAEWRRTAESFYPKIRGKIVPSDLFDDVRAMLSEYRARKPAGTG